MVAIFPCFVQLLFCRFWNNILRNQPWVKTICGLKISNLFRTGFIITIVSRVGVSDKFIFRLSPYPRPQALYGLIRPPVQYRFIRLHWGYRTCGRGKGIGKGENTTTNNSTNLRRGGTMHRPVIQPFTPITDQIQRSRARDIEGTFWPSGISWMDERASARESVAFLAVTASHGFLCSLWLASTRRCDGRGLC